MEQTKKFSGYFQAVLVALMTFTCGMSYGAYGMLIVPLADRLGISIAQAGIPATIETIAAFAAGVLGAGILIEKWTARNCVLIGCIIAALFVPAYAYLPSFALVSLFEVVVGASMGIGYSTGMAAFIRDWFIEKRETVIGVCTAAIGFGAAAGTWLFGKLDTTVGLNTTCVVFACLGIFCIIVYLIALRSPDQVGQKPLGYEKAVELSRKEGKEEGDVGFGVDFKTARKSPSLYLIMAAVLLWALSMVLTPYLATILMTSGLDEMTAANGSSVANLAVAAMAIILGVLTSKLGTRAYIVTAFGAGILGLVVLFFWTRSQSMGIMYLAALLMGAGYIVGTTAGPMLTTKVFGNKAYDQIIPWVFGMRCLGLGIGVLALPSMATAQGSWSMPILLAIAMMVVALLIGLTAVKLAPMNKLHSEDELK
ncbi:MAG: MFS transporter [Mogibacterium sp.]|nr:MFS transporter [Mogibacterium sp.]